MIRGLWVYVLAGLVSAGASWHDLSAGPAYAVLIAGRLLELVDADEGPLRAGLIGT